MNDLREAILTLGICSGPFDTPHRCSSLHCNHCGLCDESEALIALFQARERQLLTELLNTEPQLTWKKDDGSKVAYIEVSVIERLQNKANDGGSNGGL